jgi:hypothetical protein
MTASKKGAHAPVEILRYTISGSSVILVRSGRKIRTTMRKTHELQKADTAPGQKIGSAKPRKADAELQITWAR